MVSVRLKQLEIGSKLSEDVKDLNGRMLLSAGSVINEKHLKIFRTWGVTEVTIVGDDDGKTSEIDLSDIDPALLKLVDEKIDEQFINCDKNHPVNIELMNCIKLKMLTEHWA